MLDYIQISKESKSKSDFAKKIGYPFYNGAVAIKVKKIIQDNNLDVTHFKTKGGGHNKIYNIVDKVCPVCNSIFKTKSGHKREKETCSHSCSNKFFTKSRRDENLKQYRTICFRHHEKKCVVCGEDKIVTVHHFDENHNNNIPENLIPVCPTHHQYWHSQYKDLVFDKINSYRNKFLNLE